MLTQLQLLLFSALAFTWLQLSGLYPPELRSVCLDVDWLYRRAGRAMGRWILATIGRTSVRAERGARHALEAWMERVLHLHGPQGILARTWTTGGTVFCVTLLFGIVLLLSYL